MPLGDSITGSPGCWRAVLWNQLLAAGHTDIDFVGTLPPQGCGVAYDGDNEGHGGILATGIADQNQLPAWLSATSPDVVLMHLGTNDVWNNVPPTRILAAFTTMVGQMRASNPDMKVLVARIIPMNPANCTQCAQRVVDLDRQIPAWAQSVSTDRSPVTVVDQWTGFDDATDTGDGVHPNGAGTAKMAARWYAPLAALLTPGQGGTSAGGTSGGAAHGPAPRVAGGHSSRSLRRARSAPTVAASRSKSSAVMSGRWRMVKTTSLAAPSRSTRTGLWTVSPDGSVTSWSRTPKSLGGAKATVTRPMGDSATHAPPDCVMDPLSPWAQAGRLAGSEAYA